MSEQDVTLEDFAENQSGEKEQSGTEGIIKVEISPKTVELPSDWKLMELQNVGELKPSNVDKKSRESEKSVNLCNYMDVYSNEYITNDLNFMEATATGREIDRFLLEKGDVMFTKDSEDKFDIAVPAVVGEQLDNVLCGYHLFLIKPNNKIVHGGYLSKSLQHYPIKCHLASRANGTTRFGLTVSSTEKAKIPVPPLHEQRKIATILYTVDQAIKKTEEVIKQIETTGKGLRQTLFSEGYYDHETESYGTLGQVPSDWEKTRLYKIADVSRGKFTHRPRNDPAFYDGEYPFIQTGEVVDAVGELTEYNQTLNEKGRGVSKEFTPGTIIITIAGNIGDTAVAAFPVYFPDSLVGITPNEDMDEYFLEHYLRYRQNFLNRLSTKTTQKNLNLTLLRPIEVVRPPLEEQRKIAEALTSIDNQIKGERQYKKQLQQFKQGLMQDLLSGTIRTIDTNITVPDEVAQHG